LNNLTQPLDFCVLIPCFNNLPGLLSALRSIVYPPEKCCIVVVDDGSSEPLASHRSILEKTTAIPVQVISLPKNQGITQALNTGLKWIETHLQVKYIARLDCADSCQPDRFTSQVAFLDQHPEIGLLGTWCIFSTPDGRLQYKYTTPTTHSEIIAELHFRNVFIHPTVMFRAQLAKNAGYYPEGLNHVEDYGLFMRMAQITQTAILDKFLLTCEINTKGISIANRTAQLQGRYKVVSEFGKDPVLKALGLMKLRLLKLVPYKLIVSLKSRFH
jgi:glycosyltransferase involved in cell wall biosynthesis